MQKALIGFFLLFLSGQILAQSNVEFGTRQVTLNNKTLTIELAETWKQRNQGLMHRKSMCLDCGMLFDFGETRPVSMWMKNTFIPLDVAFFTQEGEIVDIKAMQPHDLTSIASSKPVRYALEMNQGWFSQQGIKAGDKITVHSAE